MAMQRGQQHDTPRAQMDAQVDQIAERESEPLLTGGPIPDVHKAVPGGVEHDTASELAYQEDDANTKELKAKVGAMVDKQFGGDMKKAFAHYDHDNDGGVGADELKQLLSDAGVGNRMTRGMWAKGIIEKLDADKDKKIQWPEFDSVFKQEQAQA